MITNTTGFRWFSKIFMLGTKVASALKGLKLSCVQRKLVNGILSHERVKASNHNIFEGQLKVKF